MVIKKVKTKATLRGFLTPILIAEFMAFLLCVFSAPVTRCGAVVVAVSSRSPPVTLVVATGLLVAVVVVVVVMVLLVEDFLAVRVTRPGPIIRVATRSANKCTSL